MAGALEGIRIIEMAGLGPGPFCGMMLADHGAEVIRIERPGAAATAAAIGVPSADKDPLARNRRSVEINTKTAEGLAQVIALVRTADGLIEGYRPGAMERMGLGPDVLLAENPKLVYGRMTGWGQEGPYAQMAGHDNDYIALSGVLGLIGRKGSNPTIPLNVVGDMGGGGMLLAFGMLAGILSARATGKGQVVDAAMVDGSALLAAMVWGSRAAGVWIDGYAANVMQGASHYAEVYETKDGKYITLGSAEPHFYATMRRLTGFDEDPDFDEQNNPAMWPICKAKMTERLLTKTRDEWCAVMEGTDACFAPVLSLDEAPLHPHNALRKTFIEVAGVMQPAPAPRFSATPAAFPRAATVPGAETEQVLREYPASTAGEARN